MLNLESRMELLGITVFQDTDKPNDFWYLPGPPHIAHENSEPLFDLFSYRKGGEGGTILSGGFLNMTVALDLGDLKDRIQQQLQGQFGTDVTLNPVPFMSGSVRVIALGEDSNALQGGVQNEKTPSGNPIVASGPRFIESILAAAQPSLDQDNRAIFSLSLSEIGAAFFMNVLNNDINARPVGVVYTLDYVGLLPAYDLEITIDVKSCYDYTRTRFTLGTLLFQADIDNIVEELKSKDSITVKEVARTLDLSKPEAIRERQNHIDQLVKELATGTLFQPSLVPGEPRVKGDTITATNPATTTPAGTTPPGGTKPPSTTSPSGGTTAPAGSQPPATTSTPPTTTGTPARPGTTPPGATPSGGTPATGGTTTPHPTTGTSSTPGGTTPGSSPATGGTTTPRPTGTPTTPGGTTSTPGGTTTGTGQTQTASDVWNKMGRPQAAFVLKNIRQEEQRTITYSLSQTSAQKQTIAPQGFIQFLADPADLSRHVHQIDLSNPFFQHLDINVNCKDLDFASSGIVQMTVQLRYGTAADGSSPKDTAEVILRSKDDNKNFTFFVDQSLTLTYEYKLIVDYQENFGIGVRDSRVEGPWTRTEVRSLSVHPSWVSHVFPVTLQLAPNIPSDVTEVQARIHYANAAHNVDDSALVHLNAQNRSQTIPIRLADANDQFEVAQTFYFSDGTSEDLPVLHLPDATSGSANEVVIINAPRADFLSGDVILLDPLGQLQTVLVDMQVVQDGNILDSRTLELSAPGKRVTWSVRLINQKKPATLRYKERRIYKDGGLEEDDWREATSLDLVAGIPAESIFTVTVYYFGPKLSVLNLSALLLDLAYTDPGGNAKFAQNTSLLITDEANTHVQDWKIRLADSQSHTYSWRLTSIHTDGSQSSSDFATDDTSKFILRP